MKYLIFILLVFVSCSLDFGTTEFQLETFVYLSRSGNDNNDGSINCPVATIEKAIEVANNIHSIRVTSGTFQTSQANLKTSIYGKFDDNFQVQSDSLETIIEGTGGWGDPKPTIYVYDESNILIDNLTIKASGSSTKKPCAVYVYESSNIVIQNCEIFGQITNNAQATYGIYFRDSNGEIRYSYINGGQTNSQVGGTIGVFCKESNVYIHHNVIAGGNSIGAASHGIHTERGVNRIEHNDIYGGSSSVYACGYRTGDFQESWNSSGADDSLKYNFIYGGSGYSTYSVISSQGSEQILKENTIDGGVGTNVQLGIYIKTDDSPHIEGNTFQNSYCSIWEHNFGNYSQDDNNPKVVRNNIFLDSNDFFYKRFRESDDTDIYINQLSGEIETDIDGTGSLASFGNTTEIDTSQSDSLYLYIQAESDSGTGWGVTVKNDSVCIKSLVLQCAANSAYKLEYEFNVPSGIDSVYLYAEFDINEYSDSFFLGINNQINEVKDLFQSEDGWEFVQIGKFQVYAGTNSLKLYPREKGVFLNCFILTSQVLE